MYDSARRDRLRTATSKNKDLVLLLKELSLQSSLDGADRARIQDALEDFEDDSVGVSADSGKRRRKSQPEEPENHDEDDPHKAHASSEREVTVLGEDLLRTRKLRSTGYVGQGSGVQWLRSLQDETEPEGPDQQPVSVSNNVAQQSSGQKTGAPASITDASFYLDADGVDLTVEVDPYELPPQQTAIKLFECYKQTVHTSFPVLPPQFEEQVRRYFQTAKAGRPFTVPDRWLAILNIVFAIGARYSHLIDAEWKGEDRDHVGYVSRSIRLLGFCPFTAAPDLALIQVVGSVMMSRPSSHGNVRPGYKLLYPRTAQVK